MARSTLCLAFFSLCVCLFSQDALAGVTEGSRLVDVNNGPPIAGVYVKVCLDPALEGEGVVITVLHYSPATGWSSRGAFSWYYTADPTGCNSRSGVYWPFPTGTLYVSAALASGGPSFYLGSWQIN